MKHSPSLRVLSTASTNSHAWCTRTRALRLTLVASLLTAAVACAVLSYLVLSDTERDVGVYSYNSIAALGLVNARAISERKAQGAQVMATMLSHALPDASQWPFVQVDGYIPIASSVAALSSSFTQSLMVFVDPDQAAAWENHTQQVYREQDRPEDTGVQDFGFGIWRNDPDSGERVHDVSGKTDWGGKQKILAPLMMHNKPAASSLLYNVYSEADRGTQLDAMLDCVKEHTDPTTAPSCTAITDMLELKVRPGPAGLLFHPIFPANNPTEFVGFATTSIHFGETLQNIVPDYVDGLLCVVSTDTSSFTYEIRNGVPFLIGPGDLHRGFDDYAHSVVLNDFIETGVATSAVYTLTIYPTEKVLDEFSTTSPLAVALGFFGVILLCMGLFFVYDALVRHEAHQRALVMDMKRRFVRFISHEIRTPLNTVCMGLDLLESEIQPGKKNLKHRHGSDDIIEKDSDMDFWHSVLVDAKENAGVAVTILNDLLDYDKIEQGTLKVQMDRVDPWGLIKTTASLFHIQALNRKIDLVVDVPDRAEEGQGAASSNADGDVEQCIPTHLNVFGDEMKLGQVLRNLLSNALKFTPEGGSIKISARHVRDGLPHVKAPTRDNNLSIENDFAHARAGSILISVTDTGVGLSQEQLGQLFSEGIQFNPNELQHGGGSGLGLNIAKGIVDQHGGTIHATSPGIGNGTTFVVELPLFTFESAAPKSTAAAASSDFHCSETDTCSEEAPRRRILVVEDSDSSRKMLIRLLERTGHSCVPAANGQEAVARIRADLQAKTEDPSHEAFDTVLMDFEMPLMRGPEATREIRRMGFDRTVLGVTGNVLAEDVKFFLSQGANEVLAKPISVDSLEMCWERYPLEKDRSRPSQSSRLRRNKWSFSRQHSE